MTRGKVETSFLFQFVGTTLVLINVKLLMSAKGRKKKTKKQKMEDKNERTSTREIETLE